MEMKRITPRSPRAALEPEHVPMPARSRRARSPMVIAGNAVITLLLLVALVVGGGVVFGKQRFERPGRWPRTRSSTFQRGTASGTSPNCCNARRRDRPALVGFRRRGLALKARGDELKFGEYQFKRQASLRDVVDTIVEGKVVQHLLHVPEGLTSEQIVPRLLESPRRWAGNITRDAARGNLAAGHLSVSRAASRASR